MWQRHVTLRAIHNSAKAGYQTLLKSQIPNVELPQDAGTVRVIAGEYGGQKGPAKTFTPINLWDVNLRVGKSAELPLPDGHTTTFLVLSGEVRVNGERDAAEGDLAIFCSHWQRHHRGSEDRRQAPRDGRPTHRRAGCRSRPVRDEQPRGNPTSV